MYEHPGNRIGDAWTFVAGETAHLFYLTAPHDAPLVGERPSWDIGHAVSTDLISWEYVGLALTRGRDGAWDDARLATGSVIERGGRYWMAFTGHRAADRPLVQRVGMAVSDDLMHWRKLPESPVSEPDPAHYELAGSGQRAVVHWRDPFLLDLGDEVVQYVCARSRVGDPATRGTVGLAATSNMRDWTVLAPATVDPVAEELEVPQVYCIDDRWYLVFCTQPRWLAPAFRRRFAGHPFRRGDYSMVGDGPRGPFRIHGTGEIVPPTSSLHVYASQLVCWHGQWRLLGTMQSPRRDAISDPIPIAADETGIHASP
jgi:beta-fructofuranosidase